MEHYAVDYRSHGELRYAGVEECACEVAVCECVCFFEESVGLVGVGEVGGCHNHIAHFFGENAEHVGRSLTCGYICFVCYSCVVDSGKSAVDVAFEFEGESRIGFGPCVEFGFALSGDFTELFAATFI